MAEITFFSKPGDAANAKQKAQLVAAGHRVAERDVMSEAWTAETLRPFFGDKPVDA